MVILIVYILTFGIILPGTCGDWYYSWYFRGDPNSVAMATRALDVNQRRLEGAEEYFLEIDESKNSGIQTNVKDDEGNIDLAIGLISVRRPIEAHSGYRLGYLTQVGAGFHKLIRTDTHFGRKELFICNVDGWPATHEEARYLLPYINSRTKYSLNYTRNEKDRQALFEKEKDDYLYCLKQGLTFRSKFIVLVEDDAIPWPDFFPVLHATLTKALMPGLVKGTEYVKPLQNLGFLKLFYPPKWQGFANEAQRIVELVGIAILAGCGFLGLFHLSFRLCSNSSRCRYKTQLELLSFVSGAMYGCLVAMAIGRQYVIDLLRVSPFTYRVLPSPGCCTQAVLYPSNVVDSLAHYLDSIQADIDFSIDLAIDSFMIENHLSRFLVEPSLMDHVGMLSSLRHYDKYAAEFIF